MAVEVCGHRCDGVQQQRAVHRTSASVDSITRHLRSLFVLCDEHLHLMFADSPRQPFKLFVELFAYQRGHFIELDFYRERMVREVFLFLSVPDLFVAHGTAFMLGTRLDLRKDRMIAMDQLPDLRRRFLHDGLFQLWEIRQHTNVPSTTF